MSKRFLTAALLLSVVGSVVSGQDAAVFQSGGSAVQQIKAGSFEDLSVKFPVAKAWLSKDFTIMTFYFKPDHWKVEGARWTITKADLAERMKDGFVHLSVIRKGKKGADLELGPSSNAAYLTEFPRRDRLPKITCSAWAKAYRKTGENLVTEWNAAKTKLITRTIPQYDAGKLVCKGQVTIVQLAPRSEVADPAGAFQVSLVDPKLEYGTITFTERNVKGSGVWIDAPAGKNRFGKACKQRVSYVWIDAKALKAELGDQMGGQDPFTWMKNDIQRQLVYAGGRVASPVISWKPFITLPSQHDFRYFKPMGEQWKKEDINGLTFEQFTGMNQQGARQPCFGAVALAQKDGRIYIASVWMLQDVLSQGQAKFTAYAKVIDSVSKTFKVLK